ncbi:hypothetical protein QTP70_012732 [Hemibagrus guttatus]|uniref:ribonuclease H n=1 Tax=Hemibagrus guttatus TaxID=175788 RepID=A0AAE0QDD8_9TELE|nr:hypothetical protein QTP70_012732 [Hemibagrus guttatus]
MYERSRTVVRCAVGQTEEFKVEVGLHQGSALSPFLFAIVMDQLSEEVRQASPWTMMFADDIVICSESREQVEESLERWRFALERRGMKVSRSKTEYVCVNEREGSGTVRLQGEGVKKVQEFKYLGSTVQSNGECGKEVKKRVQAGWNGWRKVSGVLCDRKISARIKGKVYRTVVRPAMLYGLETVSLRKRQESELEMTEGRMCQVQLLDNRKLELLVQGVCMYLARLERSFQILLLDLVSSHFNLKEKEYFGFTFVDDTFYIETISLLKEHTTVELFFLNAKTGIYNVPMGHVITLSITYKALQFIFPHVKGDIEVESELVFKLAAHALQEAKGDYTSDEATREDLKKLPTLPTKVLKEHPSLAYCEERVIEQYKLLKGVSRGQAIVQYLTLVESLPTYGVHYYEVKDKQGNAGGGFGIS